MIRLGIILFLAATLITLGALEQHWVQGSYRELDEQLTVLYERMRTQEDVDTEENIGHIDTMYEFWVERERKLTMLARHFDLSQISINIIYVKNFVAFNNKEEAFVGILNIKYLIKTHSFNVGTSIQNVI